MNSATYTLRVHLPTIMADTPHSASGTTSDTNGDRETLRSIRAQIEATDRAVIDLAHRRASLARMAQPIKRSLGLPVFDAVREQEVERLMLERARELALPEDHIHALARALIAVARAVQHDEGLVP